MNGLARSIDWSTTAAFLSALVAVSAVVWNIFWSRKMGLAEIESRIAEYKLKRLNRVIELSAKMIAPFSEALAAKKAEAPYNPRKYYDHSKLVREIEIGHLIVSELDPNDEIELKLIDTINSVIGAQLGEDVAPEFFSVLRTFVSKERQYINKLLRVRA